MEKISQCPVCGNDHLSDFLVCKDYTVSNDDFQLSKCENCGFVFTNPRPEPHQLGIYYKSEDYISHSNTSKGLINKIYLLVRNYTLNKKYALINKYSKATRLLDIGCATGMFLNVCKKRGLEVLGIEPDAAAREYASTTFGLNIYDEDYISKIESQSMDVITMWHVLEHVPDLNKRMEEIYRILKPGAYAFIAVPNQSSYDAEIYQEKWAAYDVPRHLYHFTNQTMGLLLKKHQFTLVTKLPMVFDAYYVSMLSEKYKNGRINYIKAFLNGWKSNCRAKKNDVNYSSVIYVVKK